MHCHRCCNACCAVLRCALRCTSTCTAGYEQCHGKLLRLLERLVFLRDVTPDYTYYGIASPWLQVRPACVAVLLGWAHAARR